MSACQKVRLIAFTASAWVQSERCLTLRSGEPTSFAHGHRRRNAEVHNLRVDDHANRGARDAALGGEQSLCLQRVDREQRA